MKFTSLRLLTTRNYGLLWWSGFLSDAGTWMQTVALGALVTELTQSAAWGSLTASVLFLLNGVVTPFAGVLADHHKKRKLLTLVVLAEALLATVLAVVYVTGHATPAFIVFNVALEGALLACVLPVRGALVPLLVKREDLTHALALGTASWNLGRAIGPAFAGVIIAWGSFTWIFILNAVTFVVIAFAVALMNIREPQPQPSGDTAGERFRAGLRVMRNEPGCRLALILVAIIAFTVSPFIALVPAMAQLVFDGTAVDTAHFVMAQGIGAVIGAFVFGMTAKRFGHNAVMRFTLVALPLSELLWALAPTKQLSIGVLGVIGFLYVWFIVGLNTIIQLRTDQEFRGRAIGMFWTSLSLFYPTGATLQGWLGDVAGIREVIAVASGTALTGILLALAFAWHRFDVLSGPQLIEVPDAEEAVTRS